MMPVVVGVVEETLEGEEHGSDVIGGRPLLLEDVETDVALRVHIGVEARSDELHHGRLDRVVCGEADVQRELQAFEHCALIKNPNFEL